jgi:putative heme iron utilization protein
MKRQYKAMLVSGLLILLVWGLYVTFIYMDHVPEGMDRSCWFNISASTDTCRGMVTHFGGYP